MSATRNSLVIDISHWQAVTDWKAIAASGVLGVIHKFSEGTSYRDPAYAAARQAAKDAGLLFGRYHFADGSDIATQAKNFIEGAWDTELLAIDWEGNTATAGTTMSLSQAVAFIQQVEASTGQKPVLYGGYTIKDALKGTPNLTLAKCRLWLAQYGPTAVCPPGWASPPWLWQWTNVGKTPGITGNVDQDSFAGTADQLRATWTGMPEPKPAPTPQAVPASDTITITMTVPAGTKVTVHTTGDVEDVVTG